MSRVLVILPSIDIDTTRDCIQTMRFVDPATVPILTAGHGRPDIASVTGPDWTGMSPDVRLTVVYNKLEHNLGVARSWNVGVEQMFEDGYEWLVVCSAAVRFGPPGGRDLIKFLGEANQAIPRPKVIEAGRDLGWHLIAFHRDTLRRVGPFDTIFHPAYYEDRDWSVRFQRAYGVNANTPDFAGPLWPKVDIDAELVQVAHGIKRGGVSVDFVEMEARFHAKWGPNEEYATPYDDASLDWTFTGPHAAVPA